MEYADLKQWLILDKAIQSSPSSQKRLQFGAQGGSQKAMALDSSEGLPGGH